MVKFGSHSKLGKKLIVIKLHHIGGIPGSEESRSTASDPSLSLPVFCRRFLLGDSIAGEVREPDPFRSTLRSFDEWTEVAPPSAPDRPEWAVQAVSLLSRAVKRWKSFCDTNMHKS